MFYKVLTIKKNLSEIQNLFFYLVIYKITFSDHRNNKTFLDKKKTCILIIAKKVTYLVLFVSINVLKCLNLIIK